MKTRQQLIALGVIRPAPRHEVARKRNAATLPKVDYVPVKPKAKS